MRHTTPSRLPAFILPALVALAALLPNRFDLWFQDQVGQLFSATASSNIIIVAIDEKSLSKLGRWPWPRELLAGALDKLGNARAVGLDLVLTEPSNNPESDKVLAEAIARNGRVYLPAVPEVSNGRLVETLPLPLFATAAKGVGMLDYPLDSDGLIRRTYLSSGLGYPRWTAFSALLAGMPPISHHGAPLALNNRWERRDERLLPYLDGDQSFPSLSFVDVLDAAPPIQALTGKTVLIGATASGLGDTHLTPIQRGWPATNGVIINAATTQALQQQTLARPVAPLYLCSILLVLTLVWQYSIQPRNSEKVIQAAILYGLILIGIATGLFTLVQLYLPVSSLAGLILLSSIADYFLQQRHFKRLALTDKLTELANRHHFDERFVFVLHQAKTDHSTLGLLIIDVDYFKLFNDHYGHAAGDDVLKKVATSVQKATRGGQDIAARIGGEEFAILLPHASAQQALAVATELQQQLQNQQIVHAHSQTGHVTCSIGVLSCIPAYHDTPRTLFEQADQALYQAKHNGRNRAELIIYHPTSQAPESESSPSR